MAIQSCPVPGPAFLLTRPADQSDRFADLLRARFGASIPILSSPLIVPRFLAPDLPDGPFGGLIFTSETGVRAFRRLSTAPAPAWCVGDRTCAVAQSLGMAAQSAGGDADSLLSLLMAQRPAGKMLYLRGADTRGDLATRLASAGIETVEAVVYAQIAQPMSSGAHALLAGAGPVIAPLFSPRTARLFADDVAALPRGGDLRIAAISPAVARAACPAQPDRMATALRPDAEAMLDVIATLVAASAQP